MTKKPSIFIDFDDTLTASPVAWKVAINAFLNEGHHVAIITQRRNSDENMELVRDWMEHHEIPDVTVYYTSLRSKTEFLKERGFVTYILCDNDPEAAVRGI